MSQRNAAIRRIFSEELGGEATTAELAAAVVEAGIFPPNAKRSTVHSACRRALTEDDDSGLPFAFHLPAHLFRKQRGRL